jgi:DNA-binding MarR family transcriptional regulator
MDLESRRDLQLLEALDQDNTATQRTLATRLGIALGLTNLYLKRLIRKGYVKCATVPPNRLMYSLTPRGVARKARLTYEFMKYSLDFYRDARRHLRGTLLPVAAQNQRVAIYGTGDAAELVFLLLKDMGLDLVAIFGDDPARFLGFEVLPIANHADVAYDVLIVAVLERPAGTVRRLRNAGVPPMKLVLLQPMEAAQVSAEPPGAAK